MDRIIFLGYVVSAKGIKMNEAKVKAKAIQEWPTPKSITFVRSFHSLASFYRRFVKDFSTTSSLLIEIIKKTVGLKWGEKQESAFSLLKSKLILTLLSLPNFNKAFEIECDALGISIEVVLMQEK